MPSTVNKNLAVVGAGISGKNFSGMDQFGFEIYRGLPFSGNGRQKTLAEISKSVLDQVSSISGNQTLQTSLLLMNNSLVGLFESSINGNMYMVPDEGLSIVYQKAAEILAAYKSDILLLVDITASQDTVSALALCLPEYASEKGLARFGLLSDGGLETTGKPELLVVEDDLSGFLKNTASDLSEHLHLRDRATCALAKSEPGLIALLKLVWCVNNRVIPAVPEWDQQELPLAGEDIPFYIPTESRTWFIPKNISGRFGAVVSSVGIGKRTLLSFYGNYQVQHAVPITPQLEDLNLFPFAFQTVSELVDQLSIFRKTDFSQINLRQAARFQYRRWQKQSSTCMTACLLGRTPDELVKEIDYALTGIPEAFDRSADWRTPQGSTFTPNPLGEKGSIAFVYPGAFNSYPGVGRDIFYLFPQLYERLSSISQNIGNLLDERQLYPRSLSRITPETLVSLEKQLTADPLAMLISGTCLAALYTFLLRETFDIHPTASFGYSLGEISMMFSSGVWTKADETSTALRESPLFHTRLAGEQYAVREYWSKTDGLPDENMGKIWANFVLMSSYEKVQAAIQKDDRVYVTHINTPRQVVIGGHPDGCRNVINRLKCSSLEAPFNYSLHCTAMESEFEALRTLHSWDVQNEPGMTLFSAATNKPMPIDRDNISRQIAYGLCHLLDFPRLTQTAYDEGARIFIELGAGSNCARWVDDSLSGKPHAAFSINRKGIDDYSAILQLLAKLISHRVPINLSPVYG